MEYTLIFIGISNLECAVLPPSSKSDAILDEAIANSNFPLERMPLMIVSQRNVFLWPHTKNISPLSVFIACCISLYVANCSEFNFESIDR